MPSDFSDVMELEHVGSSHRYNGSGPQIMICEVSNTQSSTNPRDHRVDSVLPAGLKGVEDSGGGVMQLGSEHLGLAEQPG